MWKANIPHTHLAQEKSDQNWMVVNGDKINFPGGGTHFHYGADKYIIALAKASYFFSFHCQSLMCCRVNINLKFE